jgi:hypothetical protein
LRHLNTLEENIAFATIFGDDRARYWNLKFDDRMHRPVQYLHWTAYCLNPTPINEPINLQRTFPRYEPTAAQIDMVTFIYLNRKTLREASDEDVIEEEQLYLEDGLISRAYEISRDMMGEAQLQALDEAQSEEAESECRACTHCISRMSVLSKV